MIQQNPTTDPTPVVAARYETADAPTLRRALLADAGIHETHAATYANAETGPELAAWCGLLATASACRMVAALLGIAQRDPGLTDEGRTRMARLVGQVLDGWPEVLESANEDLGEIPAQISGQQEIPAPHPVVFADEDDAVHLASGDGAECGAPGGGRATCLASVTCRDCLDAFHTPAAAPVFRAGDLVEITGRDGAEVTASSGANLNGKTGVVTEIDDDPEYPIGLAVEGFVGLVWCSSGEIRHADPASVATSESGAAR